MENQTTSATSIMMTYGLYSGLAAILLSVSVYAMGLHYDPPFWVSIVNVLISATLIYMGEKAFRTSNQGYLTFGEGLKIGMGISVVGGIIAIIYQQIFMNFIEPDFMTNMMEITRQKLVEQNMSSEQIDQAMEMSQKFTGPGMQIAVGIIGILFFGFIISLIGGLIMKKSAEIDEAL